MQVAIRQMGNSQGVVIPKPLLTQLGLTDVVDMQVNRGVIELRPVASNPRAAWAAESQRIAAAGNDALAWPEFGNEGDEALTW